MSVEQDIMTKVISNLNDISVANGYSADIDGVFEWRDSPLSQNYTRSIIVRDISEEILDDGQEHLLTIEIIGITAGDNSPALIRSLKQDILTAFALIKIESYVTGATYLNTEKSIEKLDKRIAGIYMSFGVTFYTEIWKT